ncbi:hypothetical protein C8R46DRAFT_1157897 [Mycena filopes]|nr:hypothetical protein C8R46DRAFT_1157897 [Mycena filopes]
MDVTPALMTIPIQSFSCRERRRATVEEVEDKDAHWVQDFPDEFQAGATFAACETQFKQYCQQQEAEGREPWYPFQTEEEWELARQSKTNDFLKLKSVREGIKQGFGFPNNRAFLKHIDTLPEGPGWHCHPFELKGDELDADSAPKVEIVNMWYQDPVECVRELLGNPAFDGNMGFVPCHVFRDVDDDGEGKNREYSEMWTAEWWWEIQAWPVYMTIGNIDKETRRSPSSRATLLIGYIPVTKLEIFKKASRPATAHQLFHDCMRVLLAQLKVMGEKGVRMDCADGFVRMRCLTVRCCENSCPRCLVDPKHQGDSTTAPWRSPAGTLQFLSSQAKGEHPPEFQTQNLRAINPFWADLPHCNIFSCITPDSLHKLHDGFFGSHLVTLRHFKKGISLTMQWTGAEHKNMEKVFLGILPNTTDPGVQRAVKGIVDFIYYPHFETHCDEKYRAPAYRSRQGRLQGIQPARLNAADDRLAPLPRSCLQVRNISAVGGAGIHRQGGRCRGPR